MPFLPDKPAETIHTTVLALWHTAAGDPLPPEHVADLVPPSLNDAQYQHFLQLLERRLSGEPLAHITGKQLFMGLSFQIDAGAMIPRDETALIGRQAIAHARAAANESRELRIIDMCTGCGNLACAIAANVVSARVWAADISDSAVALAKRNAAALGVADRVRCVQGDLFGPFENGQFESACDCVVCNPPYVTSAKIKEMPAEIIAYEPLEAFDAGHAGFTIISRVLQDARRYLKPGGLLLIETGLGQAETLLKRARRKYPYHSIYTVHTRTGEARALAAYA